MSQLAQFGVGLYIFIVGAIGLIGVAVIGFGVYVAVNRLIDKYQGYVRRPMATSMSRNDLHRKRQEKAAAKRLEIRMDGWARK